MCPRIPPWIAAKSACRSEHTLKVACLWWYQRWEIGRWLTDRVIFIGSVTWLAFKVICLSKHLEKLHKTPPCLQGHIESPQEKNVQNPNYDLPIAETVIARGCRCWRFQVTVRFLSGTLVSTRCYSLPQYQTSLPPPCVRLSTTHCVKNTAIDF